MFAIRIPAATEKRLERLAQNTGRTKEFHARKAITEHLDDMEDAAIALRRLKRPMRAESLEQVARRLKARVDD